MANPYHATGSGKFVSRRKALENAKKNGTAVFTVNPMQKGLASRVGDGQLGVSPSQTQIVMPPFAPQDATQWMKLAALEAWKKFPERAASVGLRQPPYETTGDNLTAGAPVDPTHDETVVSAARVMQYLLARFNPIRGITPQLLGSYIDQFGLGFVRQLSLAWNAIKERDDQIKAVVTKREFAVSRLDWEIITTEESDEAMAHKTALEMAYKGLTCTNVLDQNQQGGVNLLLRQMMRAIGDKWSVHEIVWQPEKENLTANFRFVPLWFFENRTGQLRYLPYELALDGIPLDAGGWLIVCADGLQVATSIAYIYKQLGLKDWARYSEKFGIPMVLGKTPAAYNSTEWNQLVEALASFTSDGAMVVNKLAEIVPFEVGRAGEMPQPAFVDRMDRAIARLWRGGDLSTNSQAGAGVGALPQIATEDEITGADAILLSEALNQYFDKWVIHYKFGSDTPKAMFRIVPPQDIDTAKEILTDNFLIAVGCRVSKNDLLKRYSRSEPEKDEELATAPITAAAPADGAPKPEPVAP